MKTLLKNIILSLTILCAPICASAWIHVRATCDNKGYASIVTATPSNGSNKKTTSIKLNDYTHKYHKYSKELNDKFRG